MSRHNEEDRNENDEDRNDNNIWWIIGGAVAGVAAIGGIVYATANSSSNTHSENSSKSDSSDDESDNNSIRYEMNSGGISSVTSNPAINNQNSLLSDIYVRYVAYTKNDFKLHYKVFDVIFFSLQKKMKEVDSYYDRYSGMKQFAGSHYDRLRIKKPDEFDMDVVIKLPLNIDIDPKRSEDSDIIIEPTDSGFVQLKMGPQYMNLLYRNDWNIHQTCYKWKDDNNYLLRTKFLFWFKGVVNKALNKFDIKDFSGNPVYVVDDEEYVIYTSESGPAITIKIRNDSTDFSMDVDLVPALRFPESRWPISSDYRDIPQNCQKDFWMVVPKENKHSVSGADQRISWRIALHYQERELLYDSYNLRTAIKLLKKLRDEQEMYKIASYYIKTIVYWEIWRRSDSNFGSKSVVEIFKILVYRFYEALDQKRIPYFWNANNNLLDGIKPITLEIYAGKLKKLLRVLDVPEDYKQIAKFLLSPSEYEEYKRKFL